MSNNLNLEPFKELFNIFKTDQTPKTFEEACDTIAIMLDDVELKQKELKKTERDLSAKRKQFEAVQEKCELILKTEIRKLGLQEAGGHYFKFYIYDNPNPALEIEDEKLIDDKYKYQVVTTEIRKDLIKADLLAGREVKGAKLNQSIVLQKREIDEEKRTN